MIKYIFLVFLVILFGLSMGGSNFGASFAAAHGGKILSKRKAQLLFAVFVILGAVTLGKPVTQTLSSEIIDIDLFNLDTVLIVMLATTISLLIANFLRVPQSTSLVTVAAIAGVGLYLKHIHTQTFFYLAFFWLGLPLLGYLITYFLGKIVYPPRKSNFWIYEKLVYHRNRLKIFVILASCFNAFSVGTNNVANAVGPLSGAGIISPILGLALIAPIFGLGSLVFTGSLKTTSQEIVPLGLLTATLICLVTGSLTLTASLCGVPQSFVMIKVASVFAISGLKKGHRLTFADPLTKKTYLSWIIMPIVALIISFLVTGARYAYFK